MSLTLLALAACKKKEVYGDCGVTGFTGPVRYRLAADARALFNAYRQHDTLVFKDTVSGKTVRLYYESPSRVWDDTVSGNARHQGDTADIGERAGIDYAYGSPETERGEYDFLAFPNGQDSLRIWFTVGDTQKEPPRSTMFWTISLTDHSPSGTGQTPFRVWDSLTLGARTYHQVYVLEKSNSVSPADADNVCYYTRADGVIAFTDKTNGRFWLRMK